MSKKIRELKSMLIKNGFELIPKRGKGSQEDNCYLVYLPDFTDEIMQPVSHGDTYQEALQHGLEVMEELIVHLQVNGKSLPVPKLISV